MLHNPLGNVLGKPPLSFLPLDPLGSDLVDKFPAPSVRGSRLDTRPILDSRSSSPSDSDTSGFSSGSDHLSDLIVRNLLGSGVGKASECKKGSVSARMQAGGGGHCVRVWNFSVERRMPVCSRSDPFQDPRCQLFSQDTSKSLEK